MFDHSRTRSTAIAVALAALLIGAGGALAADPTNDTETANTATDSNLTAGDTVDLGTINDTSYYMEGVYANDTQGAIAIEINDSDHPDDGASVYVNESMTNESVESDGTHFSATFDESELADAPLAVNSNTTLDVVLYEAANSSNNSSFQVTATNDANTRSVQYVGSGTADGDDVTVESGENSLFDTNIGPQDYSEFEFERSVTSDTEEVVVVLADADVSEDYDAQFADLDSESWKASFYSPAASASIDGDLVRTYNAGTPSDFDGTSATYETVGGEDAIVFDVTDSAEDDSTVTVESSSKGGVFTYTDYLTQSALGTIGLFAGGVGVTSLGALVVIGRPELETEAGEEAE